MVLKIASRLVIFCDHKNYMFREFAKGGDVSINAFAFLLSSRSESVPFKGFVQFSDGEFAELLFNLCLGILIVWIAEYLKPLKIFNASKLIQWRNISIPSRVEQ